MALYGGITLPDRPDPENIRRLDLMPLPMISDMMRYGIRINPGYLDEVSSQLKERMGDLRCEITNEIPEGVLEKVLGETDDNEETDRDEGTEAGTNPGPIINYQMEVESTNQIVRLLYDHLGLHRGGVEVKKTKGGGHLSTGKKTLEQLKREHPVVPLILEYRECAKLNGTYAESMPRRAKLHPKGPDCPLCGRHHYTDEYRIHTQIMTTRTVTGRTASKNPNLANIPTRTKLGQAIRRAFIASEGHVIVQRDWAQIELRLLAHRSGDPTMIQVYWNDGDIHVRTAMGTFDISDPEKVDKILHRAPAKNVNFAVCYGITGAGLLDLMAVTYSTAGLPLPEWMTETWCEEFIGKWFGFYPAVKRYLDDEESRIRRYGIAWTSAGRVRRVPEVRSCHAYIQEAGVRQGCNHGVQGDNADTMKLAMGEVQDRLDVLRDEYGIPAYPLMTIYDELLVECAEDDGETIDALLEEVMDNVRVDKDTGELLCKVPIKSDGKLLKEWKKE